MRQQTERTYKERILRVLVHIQNHLDEAVALEELAAIAHFSPYHFHRIFKGMVGESVMEHIRRLRLERAAHRLKLGNRSITRIALEAGYETHEAFTRAFGAMFDESPSRFRAKHRILPLQQVPSEVHYRPDGRLKSYRDVQEAGPPLEVRIVSLPTTHVAFMRHIGPYGEVGQTWNKFFAWAGPKGLLSSEANILGIVHDDPEVTPPEKIRYDVCVVVGDSFRAEGEFGIQQLGGEYAVATHRGPYETLGATYGKLCGQWLPRSGRELRSAPPLEFYRNSPQDTKPGELRTDIHLPLLMN